MSQFLKIIKTNFLAAHAPDFNLQLLLFIHRYLLDHFYLLPDNTFEKWRHEWEEGQNYSPSVIFHVLGVKSSCECEQKENCHE